MRKKYIISGKADGIAVVLGKYLNDDGSVSAELAERLCRALTLYKSGAAGKILVSGGRANANAPRAEADAMSEYLAARGVDESDLICERKSRNTFENARECAAILAEEEFSALYLVSSAKHIYRPYFNPYRFFRGMFGLPVKLCPSTDCNVEIVGYEPGRKNCVAFYSRKRKLLEYASLHGDCNLFAKRKFGLIRDSLIPQSVGTGVGKKGNRLVKEIEKIYGDVTVVAVL